MNRIRAVHVAMVLSVLGLFACSDDDPPSDQPTHPEGAFGVPLLLSGRPFGAAFGPTGAFLATRLDAASLGAGLISSDTISSFVPVGFIPTDVTLSADGSSAWVTNQGDGTLGFVSMASGTQTSTVQLPGSTFRVRRGTGTTVYVTTNVAKVYAINTATRAIVDSVTVGADPNGLALSPDGSRLYVSNRSSGDLSEVNTATMTVVRTIPLGGIPQDVAVSLDGAQVYVADEAGPMKVINTASGVVTPAEAGTSFMFGLALSPDGVMLIGTVPSSGAVLLIDRSTRHVTLSLPATGQPRRVAFSPLGDFAVVTNEGGWVDRIR